MHNLLRDNRNSAASVQLAGKIKQTSHDTDSFLYYLNDLLVGIVLIVLLCM